MVTLLFLLACQPDPPPPITADWQCGLDERDYDTGGCMAGITFCVGRCP